MDHQQDPNKTPKNKVSGANTKQGDATGGFGDLSKATSLGNSKSFDALAFGKKGEAAAKIGSGSVKDIENEIDRDYDRLAKP